MIVGSQGAPIPFYSWFLMNLDRLILEVHRPNFRDSALVIERKLYIAIVLDRGVGDFDQQRVTIPRFKRVSAPTLFSFIATVN